MRISFNRWRLFSPALAALLLAPAAMSQAIPHPAVASQHQRVLPLQGGQNFRDLGGYRTGNGHMVRWGMLFRSGSMHSLTPADYDYLERAGIRTVCDFRSTSERESEPVSWPAAAAPNVLTNDYVQDLKSSGLAAGAAPATGADARAMMAKLYPNMLVQFNGQYRRMFGELLAGRAPLAFNCTAGKDRTGIASALLLTALGVPRQTVIDDYLLTNRYFDPKKVVTSANSISQGLQRMPPDVIKAYMVADRSYIEAAFRVVDGHRGGAAGYLRDELGLKPADLAILRRMYTE
jgi:protein-tyrosine phosphatase